MCRQLCVALLAALLLSPPAYAGVGSGVDYSVNPADLSSYSVIATMPANPGRAGYFVCSTSTDNLIAVFDDGSGNGGTQYPLDPAPIAKYTRGGCIDWAGMPHTGRIRVYAPTANQANDSVVKRDW